MLTNSFLIQPIIHETLKYGESLQFKGHNMKTK